MEKIFGFVDIWIDEGKTDEFVEGARECHDAALLDLTGSHFYEWFLSDDGRHCVVIEAYDGPEAVAHHSKMMAGRVTKLLDIAKFEIEFSGEVPESIREAMRAKLGTVKYFGPRRYGRLTEPAPGIEGIGTCDRIFAVARFKPRQGEKDAFWERAQALFTRVEKNEPGTIGYEWFINDGGEALVLDIYKDASALGKHMQNVGPIMTELLPLVAVETTLYGAVPAEIISTIKPELDVRYFGPKLHGVI